MLENIHNRKFEYKKLTPEEQKQRGILGRLVGIIADFKRPTRNGRLYTEELWDKVFDSDIMKEKIRTKTVLGELEHPDRENIDPTKVAICLAEEPKKCSDGTIKGVFDILDTPNGRILKTLCDYGCQIGVSSRGTGDIVEDWNGSQSVDPNTYSCECWDAVILPAVESARLNYVNESLDNSKLKLRKALTESLNQATPEDRKIMEETLKQLNLLEENKQNKNKDKDNKPEMVEDRIVDSKDIMTADNVGVDVVKNLQGLLKNNKALQEQVRALQEKLSVCNAKEVQAEEANQLAQKEIKSLRDDVNSLNEQVKTINLKLVESTKLVISKEKEIKKLEENLNLKDRRIKSLNESYSKKEDIKVRELNETLENERKTSTQQIQKLQESLEDVKQDSIIKNQEYKNKLSNTQNLVEHYKKIASLAIDKYIGLKSKIVGVQPKEIKSKLSSNYSFKDIDTLCESLSSTKFDLDTLPFNRNGGKTKVQIKESKNEPMLPKLGFDDDVDDNLLSLARKHS